MPNPQETLVTPVLTQLRARGDERSLRQATELEAQAEDDRLADLRTDDFDAEPGEVARLEQGAETRRAVEEAGLDPSAVAEVRTSTDATEHGAVLTAEDVQRHVEQDGGASAASSGNGSASSPDFASDEAAEQAEVAGLIPADFADAKPSGAGGFTVADVRAIGAGKGS